MRKTIVQVLQLVETLHRGNPSSPSTGSGSGPSTESGSGPSAGSGSGPSTGGNPSSGGGKFFRSFKRPRRFR